ncbi:biotin-dependent carboxyltransferase family protein [Propionibacteriaceae bacterium Y1700]|uniref:5-oxoprolinase subunit C family protein n=1 Tax=Microlunatus sp. Y1700 TaxID=3418487 RepID=UPI003DA75412
MTLTVLDPGPQSLIEDLGRPGHAAIGVSPSGAADRAAVRLANRLVGNLEQAAVIESLLGGLEIRIDGSRPVWVAVTGATTSIDVNGRGEGSHCSLVLHPGDVLRIGAPRRGLRTYLGVRGGIEVDPVLGSAATDLLSGLGPTALQAGQELRLGATSRDLPDTDFVPVRPPAGVLGLRLGPRDDWFTDEALLRLGQVGWIITPQSNRVATRLEGPELTRRRTGELPSEAMIRGAVQVPPSGQPLIFGADHPVTGGYPVIGVVDPDGCDQLAQLRPGEVIRFAVR